MRQRRSVPRPVVLCSAFTIAFGATVAVAGTNVATAADTITCRANAAVFYTLPDTHLDLDRHNEPETGATSWTGRTTIGNTWTGKTLTGTDGRIYSILDNGDVNRQRRLATGWENGGVSQKIATGWFGVTLASQRNRITVDSTGDFYWTHDNILAWMRYDETAKTWTNRLIDTGWTAAKYDLIVGAGAGVFYARTPAGDLYRFQYDPASQRWLEYARLVGSGGWQNFAQIASAGGDVLYALDKSNGQIKWYRYLGAGSWTGPKVVGTIGTDYQLSVTTDDCKLVDPGLPVRPAVPNGADAPSAVIEGAGGKLQHFYVDGFGRLVHGRQRSGDITVVDFAVVPGYQQYTGTPSALRLADDSLTVTALGQDSETRNSTQAPATTTWATASGFGGWTPGPAVLVQRSGVGSAFAVDGAGRLMVRPQDPASKQYLPWRVLPSSGLTADLTAVVQPDGIDLVARTTGGSYTKAIYVDGTLSSWIPVPGTGWTGKLAATANPDQNLEAFAVQPDGVVVNQREQAAGFTGTWKPLAGVTAQGSPAAAVDTGGVVHVAVRATDGFVYVTEQKAPGSTGYKDWQRLVDSRTGAAYQSATDPSFVALSGGGVVVTYRDSDGVTYAYGSGAPAAAARSARTAPDSTTFSGGPLPKPSF
ncbi:tachylectin-related carbohydrate-binding protein [Amycolatopsis sp. NBC_01286]|uniref:tachylectin-related carbohydrate-binding protein n=1 Tax=Amycolatopsis sp. NBC_01286 TaxID=2903560 RepID=UPI002E15921C|nr:tachylectin-related carbohydrate-binding protein [Amycolatopsis sp. NBC_01286]